MLIDNKKGRYIDTWLANNLDLVKQFNEKDWDTIIYITGRVGTGKSTIAMQLAYYLDRTFNEERLAFNPNQMMELIDSVPKGSAIIYDEAYMGFSTRFWQDKGSKMLIAMLTMIRKKNLYLLIVSPGLFDIQKYLIVDRSRCLIMTYSKGMKRGYFAFFNAKKKAELYFKGKAKHNTGIVKANFHGKFTKWTPLNMDLYDEKKDEGIKWVLEQANTRKNAGV